MERVWADRRVSQLQKELRGWIFDIQRYSINDGPGIRTTVFFKGCPLRCPWCSNPESQLNLPQLLYMRSLCTSCGRCVAVCPTGATTMETNGTGHIKIDRSKCQTCGKCVEACLNEARVIMGKQMTVEEVFQVVKKDVLFYRNSNGGVTMSGGEPLYQPEFLKALLVRCQDFGLHTAMETCGYAAWEVLAGALENLDLVLYDVKHMDSAVHKQLTGVGNELILENLKKAVKLKTVVIRIPLIPGYNDSEENIRATGKFLAGIGVLRVDIVPYHQLGVGKYERLGRTYTLSNVATCSEEVAEKNRHLLQTYGLDVAIA